MSNKIYDFLTESIIFKNLSDRYASTSITQLLTELENYKKYVDKNIDIIKDECIVSHDEYSFSPAPALFETGFDLHEIKNGGLFLDRFIIDDPLYKLDFNHLGFENTGRKLFNIDEIKETDIKSKIYESASFLKEITPLGKIEVEYIKIFPVSKGMTGRDLSSINIPNLSLEHIDKDLIKWMNSRLGIFDFSVEPPCPKIDFKNPTDQIYFLFDNDNITFTAFYGEWEKIPTTNGKLCLIPKRCIPTQTQFKQWVEGERIKTIRDKFKHLTMARFIASKLNTTIGISSTFDYDMLCYNKDFSGYPPLYKLGLELDIPCVNTTSLERIARIREIAIEDIYAFRMQLREDSNNMYLLKTPKEIDKYIRELSKKYSEQTKDLSKKIRYKISKTDIIFDISTITITYLTVPPIYREIMASLIIGKAVKNIFSNNTNENPYLLLNKINKGS